MINGILGREVATNMARATPRSDNEGPFGPHWAGRHNDVSLGL